ncbi:LPS export ABC transporter permease LptG [Desulfonema ishimotonii]|uniref:LPS export ABC transporter permease LptG n=1 Tax=Desulfonema ishimotonii TaxID=45657 RepID=A0A401FSX8_9BACT|nr:LPS export ABC transporter permease LptG [Desulfonema ishimotonii]GBC60068.1 LPS export ABC transporter permease LptG [Desulfonema ishimotonii]
MSILYTYVTREILRYIGVVLTAVAGIYVAVDFFERIDNFMEAGLPVSRALVYLAWKIPFIISQIFPVAILLAVLIVFGLMSKNNEIIALRSSGISVYALLKPVLAIGLISSLCLFLVSEVFVPIASAKANRIWLGEVKKKSVVISMEKNIWLKDNHRINYIKYYNKSDQTIFGITLYHFDDQFRMDWRIDAEKGEYRAGAWTLHGLMEQRLDPETGQYAVRFHDQRTESLNLSPESLETVVKKSEEMSFHELREYVRRVEAEGYDATHYRVDLQAKVAFPFICLILGIVGIGLSAKGRIREGLPIAIAYGIGIAFFYWIFYSFCISLGYGGVLSPVIAAWIANFVFTCFGVLSLLYAE